MSLRSRLAKLERGAGVGQIWVPYEPIKAAAVFARHGITEMPDSGGEPDPEVLADLRRELSVRADNAASCVWRWVKGPGGQMRCEVRVG